MLTVFALLVAICIESTTVASIAPVSCQSAAPNQTTLHLPSFNLSVPDSPFGLVYSSNDVAFVALGSNLGVLNTSTSPPRLFRTIPLPVYNIDIDATVDDNGASELTITADKREVWIADGPGAVVVNADKAATGDGDAIVGTLITQEFSSALRVTLSADEDFAFVSQEYGTNVTQKRGAIQVFKVSRFENRTVSGTYIGKIVLEYSVVGSALSGDGQTLFVVSEATRASLLVNQTRGVVSALDVATLKTDPSMALRAGVDAGCQAVRIVTSPDGRYVWVTARQSNQLVVFDAAKLAANQTDEALVAKIQVGTSPVGLTFVHGGRYIITADTNRFNYTGATSGLTVVDVQKALNGAQGFPRIPSGLFPRAFAVSPDGNTVLVSQYDSQAVQALDIRDLDAMIGSNSTSPTTTGQPTAVPTAAAAVKDFSLAGALVAGIVEFLV